MLILGIETSCDETAASVVEDGRIVHSNIVASQVELHARYGGIVPEVASRQHMLQVVPVVERAMAQASASWDALSAVAVTHGPGLAGALMVGVNMAKAVAFARRLPLYGVNHLEGHIYAAWLEGERPDLSPGFPLVCLVASGGHTDLALMDGHGRYRLLGMTRDDAAGESFDKAARVLGLGYPGGPAIQRAAEGVSPPREELPRAWLRGTLDFSFSGLKTALLHRAQAEGHALGLQTGESLPLGRVQSLAAAFQDSVAEVLAAKTLEAAAQTGARGIILGGGVVANTRLRECLRAQVGGLPVFIPSPQLCVDNAAMIAAAAYYHALRRQGDGWDLDILPSLRLG
ncbi:MAG: tRNA (adenosine(37)-N6)-threonylcarbamoyltransferase complex transferase subunit TsaD [Chloroflexi bacterium]|nr:tRNA (adenosine(37)-N6)-threonylcarbamoyltransferase complex transferase subunit TsaD [Chloroflexota bacterium]